MKRQNRQFRKFISLLKFTRLPCGDQLVRRQNAFEHFIRIFRFLVIQFRCGKRQDTIPTNMVYTQGSKNPGA